MTPRKRRAAPDEPTDLCISCGAATGTRFIKGSGWICYGCDEGQQEDSAPDPDEVPDEMLLESFRDARAERRAKEREE